MSKPLIGWISIYAIVFTWSAIQPIDRFTWFLEILPALIGLIILAVTYRQFRLTPLVYILILVHCIILMIGGHYTYAEVPLFDWVRDNFGMARNNYDKVGHFAQGFIPVMIAREIVLRKQVFQSAAWMNFFIVCFCLAFSALYELFEWWIALASGEAADSFLGTQGYAWDTQSDMGLALLGSIIALTSLAHVHDRQLRAIAV
jgi:putative membrane protein